jgi:hypothetical protein
VNVCVVPLANAGRWGVGVVVWIAVRVYLGWAQTARFRRVALACHDAKRLVECAALSSSVTKIARVLRTVTGYIGGLRFACVVFGLSLRSCVQGGEASLKPPTN